MHTEDTHHIEHKRPKRYALAIAFGSMIAFASASTWICYRSMQAEAYSRYMGIRNVVAERISRIIRGVEINAYSTFQEVEANHGTADEVIEALKRKANINLDVRGYFAAFEPEYFPERGTWFEPYIYQPEKGGFDFRQVGSARHNYFTSDWYKRCKATGSIFWSDPYYYYDGTAMSGHYTTFVKPLFDHKGDLVCVLGADMKFEWLSKELEWVENSCRGNEELNKHHLFKEFDFSSIILSHDGNCIAYTGEEAPNIIKDDFKSNLTKQKRGVARVKINGKPYMIYYGPIEFVNWYAAIAVPQWDFLKPMLPASVIFLFIAIVGMSLLWYELKKR